MGRAILAVIVSYVVMFLLTIATFICAYLVLGADQAFKPKLYQASNRWAAMSFVIHIIVGIIGGLICVAISKGGRAPVALAGVAVVVGMLLAIPVLMRRNEGPKVRVGEVSVMEAMQRAKQPIWVPFTLPIVAAIGVLIGGKLKRQS